MRRYHVKLILLSLGVVLGYGSATARYTHHREHPDHHRYGWFHGHHGHHGDCWWDDDSKPSPPSSSTPQPTAPKP